MNSENKNVHIGKVTVVLGPVVDVEFDGAYMPKIHEKLLVKSDGSFSVPLETFSHVKSGVARCIALRSTEGMSRGMPVYASGEHIKVPVGEGVLGRVMNVLGEPIDKKGEIKCEKFLSIHRKAPEFSEQSPSVRVLETGIKVIDLIAPYARGGKIGLFGGDRKSVV